MNEILKNIDLIIIVKFIWLVQLILNLKIGRTNLITLTSAFCFPLFLPAQTDSIQLLPTAKITANSIRNTNIGSHSKTWTNQKLEKYASTNITEILQKESGIFVKSYGLGSLATTSIRGSGAGHTAVIWNGFSLQNPMLGLLDLALLPASFIDEMTLSYGGSSALWGSGAIGGRIDLTNKKVNQKGFSIGLQNTLGSFGFLDLQLKTQYENGKFGGSTRYFIQKAKNDFSYRINSTLPEKRQSNSATFQAGILQELYWKIKPNQQLDFRVWWQKIDKEIPPTTTQTRSLAQQKDDVLRTGLHYKNIGKNSILKARTGLFREAIDFQDDAILLKALSHFYTLIAEVENQLQITKNQKLHLGFNHTFTTAIADGYTQNPKEHRSAIFAAYQLAIGKWTTQFNLRQALVDGRFLPFVPGIAIEGQLYKRLIIKGKVTRNYRLPTLNDRFWNPGGNEDLQAESGWSEELSLTTNLEKKAHRFQFQLGGFNRNIDNWILWTIRSGENYWSAHNITEVWSRGLESIFSWHFEKRDWKVSFSGGYDFVRSTYQNSLENPKITKGDQLIYVPKHRAFSNLSINWESWNLNYQHQFTGAVSGVNVDLKQYQIGNCGLDWKFEKKKFKGQFFLKVENIWNTNYRVIERRVMPRRYFRFGMKVNFITI